ncbi:peptidylprolyl isomerase [Massilia sp. B-10]|nr:peptidylprolyl isomerase [Massilia sp. B-10]UUZ56503.1 peptidylprolyl isomerase [Massilia sp. H-1]
MTTPSATGAKETVVATVNGTPIYSGVVDMMVKERTAQGQPDSPELRKMIIENLAMQSMVAGEASKKVWTSRLEVTRQMDMLRQSLLANAFVQDYIKSNPVTDEMVKAEYDKMNSKVGGDEFKARHILVKTEAEAKDIIAKLKKDMKQFGAIAKDKSQDPGSKVNGGDLGWFNPA